MLRRCMHPILPSGAASDYFVKVSKIGYMDTEVFVK
jgi:hypothetical protein